MHINSQPAPKIGKIIIEIQVFDSQILNLRHLSLQFLLILYGAKLGSTTLSSWDISDEVLPDTLSPGMDTSAFTVGETQAYC